MNVVDAGVRPTKARGMHCSYDRRTKVTLLGIDKLVENLAATFTRAGAPTIQTVVSEGAVRCAVDQEEMGKAFATLVRLVARGAAVSILGGLVPITAGEENGGTGCALLSISVREQSAKPDPSVDALTALRAAIRKHRGSFRLWRRGGDMRFSVYLPVLHGA